MSATTKKPIKKKAPEAYPMLERYSELHGMVRVYNPPGEPNTWNASGWRLTTERGADGPISATLSFAHLHEAYERPHFIDMNPSWLF